VNTAKEALIRIGGNAVEAALLPLVRSSEPRARVAMEVLFALQKARFLPQLRRLVDAPELELRSTALRFLGSVGTPQDIQLLAPLADFWKGDRPNHYWAMSAIAEIRQRHHYDMNGPIR
jgi:HEAT repeat protein